MLLLLGKFTLFLLELSKLLLLFIDCIGFGSQEIHGVISLNLHVFLELFLLLGRFRLGEDQLLLLVFLIFFGDLLLELGFLLLSQLLELRKMLDRSELVVDDVFI